MATIHRGAISEETMNVDIPREPSSIMLELDDLLQHTVDLNMLGDIAYRKRTVQRKRGSFRVFVSKYWNIPRGKYKDGRKVKYLRTPKDVEKFMRLNDYYDPEWNSSGTKGYPDRNDI